MTLFYIIFAIYAIIFVCGLIFLGFKVKERLHEKKIEDTKIDEYKKY